MRYIDKVYLRAPLEEDSYLNAIPAIRSLIKSGGIQFSSDVTFFFANPVIISRFFYFQLV